MVIFIYDGFACVSANEDEILFSNGRGEIRLEHMNFDCVPMQKYKFTMSTNEKGNYRVFSFEKDKFDKFHVKLVSTNEAIITVTMHLDSYSKNELISFKRGTKFNVLIEW